MSAQAHDAPSGWTYPRNCCADQDCKPVPCDQISDDGYYYHWQDLLFTHPQHDWSGDRFCHVCYRFEYARERQGIRLPRCIFTPIPRTSWSHHEP